MYTVADLIKDLQQFDPALPVIVQADPEGNGYHECRGVDLTMWSAKDDETADELEAEMELSEDAIKVIIVYP